MCARTLCPFSSVTRNMALGRGSVTVPSTSIASFFATLREYLPPTVTPRPAGTKRYGLRTRRPNPQYRGLTAGSSKTPGTNQARGPRQSGQSGLDRRRQNLRTVLREGDRVLEMGRQGTFVGPDGPAVRQDPGRPFAQHGHRFHGDHEPGTELRPPPRGAEVEHLRVLVEVPPHAVTRVLPHEVESGSLHHLLDRVGDVRQPSADADLPDAGLEGVLGDPDELLGLRGGRLPADEQGDGGVGVIALPDRAEVERQQIAGLEDALAGDAVDDLLVDRDAERCREPAVPLQRRRRAGLYDRRFGDRVKLCRLDPRAHGGDGPLDRLRDDAAGLAHPVDLLGRLADDHDDGSVRSEISSAVRASTSSALPSASISRR